MLLQIDTTNSFLQIQVNLCVNRIQQSSKVPEVLFSIRFLTVVFEVNPNSVSIQTIQCFPGLLFPRLMNASNQMQSAIFLMVKTVLLSQQSLGRSFLFSVFYTRCRELFRPHMDSLSVPSLDAIIQQNLVGNRSHCTLSGPEESLAVIRGYLNVIVVGCECCPEEMKPHASECWNRMLRCAHFHHIDILRSFLHAVRAIVSLGTISTTIIQQQMFCYSLIVIDRLPLILSFLNPVYTRPYAIVTYSCLVYHQPDCLSDYDRVVSVICDFLSPTK